MLSGLGRPLRGLARWLGGWSRLLLLVLAVGGVIGGLIWERQRHPTTPPGASEIVTSLMPGLRQTTFRYSGSVDEVRAWYRDSLGGQGWTLCGTQATPDCTNLVAPNDGTGAEVDVYRRNDDTDTGGVTVEVWPQRSETGDTFVTVWETQAP